MQEKLDKVTVRDFPIDLKGIRVVAVNVDPRRYLGRLQAWQKRVEAAGAREWRVINDIEHLDGVLMRPTGGPNFSSIAMSPPRS